MKKKEKKKKDLFVLYWSCESKKIAHGSTCRRIVFLPMVFFLLSFLVVVVCVPRHRSMISLLYLFDFLPIKLFHHPHILFFSLPSSSFHQSHWSSSFSSSYLTFSFCRRPFLFFLSFLFSLHHIQYDISKQKEKRKRNEIFRQKSKIIFN